MGLAGWYLRFIANFSELTRINNLLAAKKVRMKWRKYTRKNKPLLTVSETWKLFLRKGINRSTRYKISILDCYRPSFFNGWRRGFSRTLNCCRTTLSSIWSNKIMWLAEYSLRRYLCNVALIFNWKKSYLTTDIWTETMNLKIFLGITAHCGICLRSYTNIKLPL